VPGLIQNREIQKQQNPAVTAVTGKRTVWKTHHRRERSSSGEPWVFRIADQHLKIVIEKWGDQSTMGRIGVKHAFLDLEWFNAVLREVLV